MTYSGFDHDLSLKGKVAAVTGAASGIGNASVKLFLEKGAKVALLDRTEKVVEIAQSLGENAFGLVVDVTDPLQVKKVVAEVVEHFGSIDIACNIAGVGSLAQAEDISVLEYLDVININLNGTFFFAQAVGQQMIRQGRGGRIINMASQAGIVAIDGHVAYSASKSGVLAVTRALALEWGEYGITCNAISPTVVMTPLGKAVWTGERGDKHLSQIPAGRFAEMDEIAMAVVYLASDAAAMFNGSNLVIDGGFTIG